MRRHIFLSIVGLLILLPAAAAWGDAPAPMRLDPAWLAAPKMVDAPDFKAEGVRGVYYDSITWKGQHTRAFAWIGLPATEPGKPAGKFPAMVLVHGGGGTAFDRWVRLWTSRGYAAIAMDTCGQVPRGKYGHWDRDPQGGPPGWGGLDQMDLPPRDQWTYHAVADVVLAHSLIRSLPEVDADRIGITGISWGGYLTCIVAGLDGRFKMAAPVYGCGFLGDDSVWVPQFTKMGKKSADWLAMWDPSKYLPDAKMPMLWVDGTNDFAYPLDSLQRSYRLPPGPRTLCTRVRMVHAHGGPGESPAEIRAFADHFFNGALPMATITGQGRKGQEVWASFESASPIEKVELNFTRDGGIWQKRKWETAMGTVDAKAGAVHATLPEGVSVYYLNLIDQRGLIVSTEHAELRGKP